MKMLLVVYRYYLEDDVQGLLAKLSVTAFSEAPKILGMGEAGKVADSHVWPGHNCCIFAALPESHIAELISAFRSFSDQHRVRTGKPAPLKAFVLPCEEVL